jgi:hypothetical protein
MSKRVFLARSPDGRKVTTIDIRQGIQAIPYGWEYVVIDRNDIPSVGKLRHHWDQLVVGERISISTLNLDKLNAQAVLDLNDAVYRKFESLQQHKVRILEKLDVDFIRSLEDKTIRGRVKTNAVVRFKNDLRNFAPSLDDFDNRAEFLDYWPDLFEKTLSDYVEKSRNTLLFRIAGLVLTLFVLAPICYMFITQ